MATTKTIAKRDNSVDEKGVQLLSSDPGSPVEGQTWINTSDQRLRHYTGGDTKDVGLISRQYYSIKQPSNALTDRNVPIRWNLGTATIINNGASLISAVDNSGSSRTEFTANQDCIITIVGNFVKGSSATRLIYRHYQSDGTTQILSINGERTASGANTDITCQGTFFLQSGEKIIMDGTDAVFNGGNNTRLQIFAMEMQEI